MSRSSGSRIVTALIFTVCFLSSIPVLAEVKLAYVRSSHILRNYAPYSEALKKYNEFEKGEVEKFQKKTAAFQQKVADSQKQAAFMTEDKINDRRVELEQENAALEQEYEGLHNRQDGVLAKKYAEFLKPVFDNVNQVIFDIRKEEGYSFIFEAESEAILDADTELDISEKVVERLSQLKADEPSADDTKKDN